MDVLLPVGRSAEGSVAYLIFEADKASLKTSIKHSWTPPHTFKKSTLSGRYFITQKLVFHAVDINLRPTLSPLADDVFLSSK